MLLTSIVFSACGDPTTTSAPATTAAAATKAASSQGSVTGSSASGPVPTAATDGSQPANQSQAQQRYIIRNATLWVNTNDIEQLLAVLRGVAVDEGGYVFQENSSQAQPDKPSAVIVLQVPSQSYESTITRIRQSALKVERQESSSSDVSEEYTDLRSQVVNLQRTEEGLQKLVDKAEKLEDILSLQKELTNIRGEIEKRQGRLNFLDKRTSFSTITINISLPPVAVTPKPTPAPTKTWEPDVAASDAWNASITLLGGLITALIRVVVFIWWLIPFLVIAFVWWRIYGSRAKKLP
jgi:hypothetical protein